MFHDTTDGKAPHAAIADKSEWAREVSCDLNIDPTRAPVKPKAPVIASNKLDLSPLPEAGCSVRSAAN